MRRSFVSALIFLLGIQLPAAQQPATANWYATAQTVLDVVPEGWSSRSPVVIFASALGGDFESYRCYAEAWKHQGIRTVIPLMAGGITFEQRRSRWRQLNIIYEALRREVAGNWKREPSPANKIVFAGNSFGAYVALLAAGADSRLHGQQAGNCAGGECPALPAGVVDVPTCRGDAHTARPEQSTLLVVPEFEHSNFGCAQSEPARAKLAVVQRQMGDWLRLLPVNVAIAAEQWCGVAGNPPCLRSSL